MPLLEIRDLHAGYQKGEVLHGMSLTAAEGQITAVVGPNGAGKSTLAKTIAGMLQPASGSVLLDGDPLERRPPRERALAGIGYMPQGRNVFPDLTVHDNLSIVTRSFRVPAARVDEVLEQFPILRERRRQRAGTLSGGERQQLAIACSLLGHPRMLVLDEPTTGLAPQVVSMLVEKILEIRDSGSGVFWIIEEHPTQILPHCEAVYLVEGGRVRHTATGAELLADPDFTEMFLGADGTGLDTPPPEGAAAPAEDART
jgi:ABC-type branched-subunit amino acid transport system ATPase component